MKCGRLDHDHPLKDGGDILCPKCGVILVEGLPEGGVVNLLHEPPVCDKCLMQLGLSVSGDRAKWVCPNHGPIFAMPLCKINGAYDLAKVGLTE